MNKIVSSVEGPAINERHPTKDELYLETYQEVHKHLGEVAANNYYANLLHTGMTSFGPTGEMVNPLPEARNIPVLPNTSYSREVSQQTQIDPHARADNPSLSNNVIPLRQPNIPREMPAPLQGPENGPFQPLPARRRQRLLARIAFAARKLRKTA